MYTISGGSVPRAGATGDETGLRASFGGSRWVAAAADVRLRATSATRNATIRHIVNPRVPTSLWHRNLPMTYPQPAKSCLIRAIATAAGMPLILRPIAPASRFDQKSSASRARWPLARRARFDPRLVEPGVREMQSAGVYVTMRADDCNGRHPSRSMTGPVRCPSGAPLMRASPGLLSSPSGPVETRTGELPSRVCWRPDGVGRMASALDRPRGCLK